MAQASTWKCRRSVDLQARWKEFVNLQNTFVPIIPTSSRKLQPFYSKFDRCRIKEESEDMEDVIGSTSEGSVKIEQQLVGFTHRSSRVTMTRRVAGIAFTNLEAGSTKLEKSKAELVSSRRSGDKVRCYKQARHVRPACTLHEIYPFGVSTPLPSIPSIAKSEHILACNSCSPACLRAECEKNVSSFLVYLCICNVKHQLMLTLILGKFSSARASND